jgi:16S rRNA (cytidine1402-2'-O)-methyltransferase
MAALTSSGLPTDKFSFLGYPPEKQGQRIKMFTELQTMKLTHTNIFYCAPHKLEATLVDMQQVFGNIEIVVARELTKIHEEVWKGPLTEAQTRFKDPKGEFVLLFTLVPNGH